MEREFPILIGERLDPSWPPLANAAGFPAQNPLPFSPIQPNAPNAPNAPFFGTEDAASFSVPVDQPFPGTGNEKNGQRPYPANPNPFYGFSTGIQPYPPSMPGSAGGSACPYPPTAGAAIGFVGLNPAPNSSTAILPPSYEDCMATKK